MGECPPAVGFDFGDPVSAQLLELTEVETVDGMDATDAMDAMGGRRHKTIMGIADVRRRFFSALLNKSNFLILSIPLSPTLGLSTVTISIVYETSRFQTRLCLRLAASLLRLGTCRSRVLHLSTLESRLSYEGRIQLLDHLFSCSRDLFV